LRLVGFEKSEVFEIPLSEIVSLQEESGESARTGRLIPIIIRSVTDGQASVAMQQSAIITLFL
jgi:hypothetical protein